MEQEGNRKDDGVSEPESKKRRRSNEMHIEVMLHPYSNLPQEEIKKEIESFVSLIGKKSFSYEQGPVNLKASEASKTIKESCLEILLFPPEKSVATWTISSFVIHFFTIRDDPAEPEEIEQEGDDEPITVCETLCLPHLSLHSSWENLILPSHIQNGLLNYARSALLFSNKNVSPHIINWNRVLLLYGKPGCGKTSLCKALAHKLAIRNIDMFPSGGYLLEIKSHSLFSKWFSESGKLIARLFNRIREMVEDEPDALFVVLIDEVESLANSRVGSNGTEPSDTVRAVNSLLTSLDSIRQFRNVLIVSTSNITDCIDSAFVDRVDWMIEVPLPCLEARYEILRSCLAELGKVGIVDFGDTVNFKASSLFLDFDDLKSNHGEGINDKATKQESSQTNDLSEKLMKCAQASENLSGRALRKLPFQTHAFVSNVGNCSISAEDFLKALEETINRKVKGKI